MNVEKYIPHFVSLTLLVLGAVEKSAAMAYGAVVTLGLILAREAWDKAHVAKVITTGLPDEAKRKIQDLEARVTTIEYGIKQRGF
jgi:capsule polysaccharide export protein KpsC/LpsZ